MDRINAIAENLKQRGFEVFIADTAAAAKELALSLIPTGRPRLLAEASRYATRLSSLTP